MKKTGYKVMTEGDFDFIKSLLGRDIKTADIERITGRADGTISRIRNAHTWKEYQESVREVNKKTNGASEAHAPKDTSQYLGVLSRIAEALELIEGHLRVKETAHSEVKTPENEPATE